MKRNFENYSVQILDKEFDKDNIFFSKTAEITLLGENDKIIEVVELGYLEIEKMYDLIERDFTIHLDQCYIANFSLSEFRKLKNYKDISIKIRTFTAENSFFDLTDETIETIDFSSAWITNGPFSLNNAIFAKAITFEKTIFPIGGVDIQYAFFRDGNVTFSGAVFNDGELTFKNTIFGKGTKFFDNIHFGVGEKIFVNTEFGDGDAIFSESDFNSGKANFKVSRFGKGKVDFSKASFGNSDVVFEKAEFGKGNVSFRSAQFGEGLKDFTRSEFDEGEVTFENTIFGRGDVYFVGTDFHKGKVSFKLAEFGDGKIDFHYSKFGEGDIIFERTKFGTGGVDFRAAEFNEGKISFNRAEFGDGDVIFEASELKKGTITFRRSVFGNGIFNFETAQYENAELIIDDVNFGQGKVSFKRSKFTLLSLKSCILNNYFDLRVEKCGKLDLSDTIVKDLIDVRPTDEYKVTIDALDLSGIRLLGRLLLEWKGNNVKELIYNQDTSFRNKSEQFRVLKENYNINGRYSDEDEAYVEFKRTEARADLFEEIDKKPKVKLWAYIKYWAQWIIFDKVGLYATDPIRVLFSVFVIYIGFSLFYFAFSIIGPDFGIIGQTDDARALSPFGRCFYFSAITFFTIGYGDATPAGFLKFFAALEGFSGVFMMSYFTVAFVRKILR